MRSELKLLGNEIQVRRRQILDKVSQLLRFEISSPLVRQAAFSVISLITGRHPSDYADNSVKAEVENFRSEEALRALLPSCELFDRIDIELSVHERLLRAMDTRHADPQDMLNAIRDYQDARKRYMKRLRQLQHLKHIKIVSPHFASLPFNGDNRILSILMRYSPQISFRGTDIFGYNALSASLLTGAHKDIERLVQNMDNADFVDLAADYAYPADYGTAADNGLTKCTVLHIAAIRGISCIFEKFEEVRDLDQTRLDFMVELRDEDCWTPLIHAVSRGDCNIVRKLLELGAAAEAQDSKKRNALHHAAYHGYGDITRLLSAHDESLCTAYDHDGYRPFHCAIKGGRLQVAKLFTPVPARSSMPVLDPTKYDGEPLPGLTEYHMDSPFMVATRHGHIPIMEWLLNDEHGNVIDLKDHKGMTPLMLAAEEGRLEAVEFLLSRGADASLEASGEHKTPCDFARARAHQAIVSLLEDNAMVSLLEEAMLGFDDL